MHGIPVLIKDNIDKADMINYRRFTCNGRNIASQDAFVVKKLRESGAVIIGKNKPERMGKFPVFQFAQAGAAVEDKQNLLIYLIVIPVDQAPVRRGCCC